MVQQLPLIPFDTGMKRTKGLGAEGRIWSHRWSVDGRCDTDAAGHPARYGPLPAGGPQATPIITQVYLYLHHPIWRSLHQLHLRYSCLPRILPVKVIELYEDRFGKHMLSKRFEASICNANLPEADLRAPYRPCVGFRFVKERGGRLALAPWQNAGQDASIHTGLAIWWTDCLQIQGGVPVAVQQHQVAAADEVQPSSPSPGRQKAHLPPHLTPHISRCPTRSYTHRNLS